MNWPQPWADTPHIMRETRKSTTTRNTGQYDPSFLTNLTQFCQRCNRWLCWFQLSWVCVVMCHMKTLNSWASNRELLRQFRFSFCDVISLKENLIGFALSERKRSDSMRSAYSFASRIWTKTGFSPDSVVYCPTHQHWHVSGRKFYKLVLASQTKPISPHQIRLTTDTGLEFRGCPESWKTVQARVKVDSL